MKLLLFCLLGPRHFLRGKFCASNADKDSTIILLLLVLIQSKLSNNFVECTSAAVMIVMQIVVTVPLTIRPRLFIGPILSRISVLASVTFPGRRHFKQETRLFQRLDTLVLVFSSASVPSCSSKPCRVE